MLHAVLLIQIFAHTQAILTYDMRPTHVGRRVDPPSKLDNRSAHGADDREFRVSEMILLVRDVLGQVGGSEFGASCFARNSSNSSNTSKHNSSEEYVKNDLFPSSDVLEKLDIDKNSISYFFGFAPMIDWLILLFCSLGLILFDCVVLQRAPSTFVNHIMITIFWIFIAISFNGIVWYRFGKHLAIEWLTGYFLEWMLSMDNLFVFHLVFQMYGTPLAQMHKAVFIGILGAVVLRLVFFTMVSSLLNIFGWLRWPFGILLIWSGYQAVKDDADEDEDVSDFYLLRFLKYFLGSRLVEAYDGSNCFTFDTEGRLQVTLLFVSICCLEFTDLVFALDSVSAKIAQIPNMYVCFSSSVLAMFALRSMFFIVKDLVDLFGLLKYGIGIILVFIGVELMFAEILHLSSSTVCILILAVFFICILGSRCKYPSGKKTETGPSLESSLRTGNA